MLVGRKSSLILATPITNKLASKYKLYISLNGILVEGVPSLHGKILEQNFFIALSSFSHFVAFSSSSPSVALFGLSFSVAFSSLPPSITSSSLLLTVLDIGLRQNT